MYKIWNHFSILPNSFNKLDFCYLSEWAALQELNELNCDQMENEYTIHMKKFLWAMHIIYVNIIVVL